MGSDSLRRGWEVAETTVVPCRTELTTSRDGLRSLAIAAFTNLRKAASGVKRPPPRPLALRTTAWK